MARIAYLDGWRGCAILLVLVAHFGTTQFINLGRFGVEVFFVLSGRLMAEILFVRETPLASFFPRRFSRIYPALAVMAALMMATAYWRGGDPTTWQFLSAVTFTANYAQFSVGRSPVLDHVWSLCIEEHMYILLGLIAFVHRRRTLPLLWILIGLALVGMVTGIVQTSMGFDYYDVYWRTDVRGASLLMGAIAYLSMHQRVPAILSGQWTPVLLGGAALLLNVNAVPDPIKYTLGTAMLATALILMTNAPKSLFRLLENPLLLRFGIWSYSIYLWQQPFAKLEGSVPMRFMWMMLAVLCALASFYLVEKPMRQFLNNLFATRKARIA